MFPLGSVLLPHNALPLHVFEPRYRQMIETVLDDDRHFGVVLIERGSEVGGDDVRTDVGCLAEIREIQQM
ncbi:MAG: LON peptidase substrate-binding domain-containing protein, partial [Acidimicrobiia bacterium]|nr:LON peptidase substrate-binding domain-containing protein [Acidimicrobiia bacterium]